MLQIVHFLLNTLFLPEYPHEVLRLNCITQLKYFFDELKDWGPLSGARVGRFARNHVTLYAELARNHLEERCFQRSGYHPWKFLPKHRLFLHLGEEQAKFAGNPAEFWAYLDEDSIGKAVDLAEFIHSDYLHRSLISKYRL